MDPSLHTKVHERLLRVKSCRGSDPVWEQHHRSKVALEVPMKAAEIGNMAAKPSAPMATKAHNSRRGHADQEQEMRDDKDAGHGESRARGWNRR